MSSQITNKIIINLAQFCVSLFTTLCKQQQVLFFVIPLFIPFALKSPQSSRQCVGILDVRSEFVSEFRHFLAETLRLNKICHEKETHSPALPCFLYGRVNSLMNFLEGECVQVKPLTYKINAHNMSEVRSQNVVQWATFNLSLLYLSQLTSTHPLTYPLY